MTVNFKYAKFSIFLKASIKVLLLTKNFQLTFMGLQITLNKTITGWPSIFQSNFRDFSGDFFDPFLRAILFNKKINEKKTVNSFHNLMTKKKQKQNLNKK